MINFINLAHSTQVRNWTAISKALKIQKQKAADRLFSTHGKIEFGLDDYHACPQTYAIDVLGSTRRANGKNKLKRTMENR